MLCKSGFGLCFSALFWCTYASPVNLKPFKWLFQASNKTPTFEVTAFPFKGYDIKYVTISDNNNNTDINSAKNFGIDFTNLADNSNGIDDKFYSVKKSRFYFSKEKLTWNEAYTSCELNGMNLVTIETSEEQDDLITQIGVMNLNPQKASNQILAADLEDAFLHLEHTSLHPRVRRDEDATMDEKCKKRHKKHLCCGDETFDKLHESDKEYTRSCFKEILGVEKKEHHHKKFDLFSCEEAERRKNDMICVSQCVGQKKGLLDENGQAQPEIITKVLQENVASKEPWLSTSLDRIVSVCLAEAKNATDNQVKPSISDIKVCNPTGITLKHCIFREIQLSCPADQIKDRKACDRFQERIKKGFDFYGAPPPQQEDDDAKDN